MRYTARMSLLDQLIAGLAPHICCGCGRLGYVLCPTCADMVQILPPRCYRCQRSSPLFKTCKRCLPRSRLRSVYVWGEYTDVVKQVVHALKYERAMQAAQDCITAIPLPLLFAEDTVLVPVPTTPGRVRQRGYDQAELLALELGKRTGLQVRQMLTRTTSVHQVGASGALRRKQLTGAFKANNSIKQKIILIDDVLTTGTTLEEAARTLKEAGCRSIDAIVIAQA